MQAIDEVIEKAVNEIHQYFTSGSGPGSKDLVRSEKEVIRKAIRWLLGSISHYEIRRWAKEPTCKPS